MDKNKSILKSNPNKQICETNGCDMNKFGDGQNMAKDSNIMRF